MSLQIGSARMEITPRVPAFLAGYGSRDHAHESIHDQLHARALYAEDAEGTAALVVSADILWFGPETERNIRALLKKELDLPSECVLLAGVHTHSAPVVGGQHVNREWLHVLEGKVLAAAALAKTRLQPVRLRVGRATCAIGVNRREIQADGSISLGHNPDGPVDRELIVVEARDGSGQTVARLLNYACHGVVLGPRNYEISGDWCGVAATAIENDLGGAAALFLNGGCGNVDPRIRVQTSFEPVHELADEFVRACTSACREAEVMEGDESIAGLEHVVLLPRKQTAVDEGLGRTRRVCLRGLRIGPVCLAGYPGEMFSQTSMAVKEQAANQTILAISYADAGNMGYLPVAEAYDDGGYEVGVSPYSDAAEAVLRQGLLDVVARLQEHEEAAARQ